MTEPNSKRDIYMQHSAAGLTCKQAAAAMGIQEATVRTYARINKIPFAGLVFVNPVIRPAKQPRHGVVTWERREPFGHVNRVSLVAVPGVQIGGVM
jgi:hypothetical protein